MTTLTETNQPELSEPFPVKRDIWTCPITGIKVPKNPVANLIWRAKLLEAAENDPELQEALYTAASQSVLFFVNTFCWTYRVFVIDENGTVRQVKANEAHVPYVTWEIQDNHILEIERAIDIGYDLLTDKARDMGATWDHVVVFHHQWLFKADRTFLEISRKEDCVDTLGKAGQAGSDPGTLFGKHDYLNRWLPEWMLPMMDRKRMHLLNMANQSRIDGETASATAGSSDRRTAVLLDEMAKMENGEAIKRSTKDVTACRLANSTPNGAGTAYTKWYQSGQVKVVRLMYWEHPEKGVGRYVRRDEATGKWEVRSPWFDKQCEERTPKEIAIEILADHIGSGDTFFEAQNIEIHRGLFARPAKTQWTVRFQKGISNDAIPSILMKWHKNMIVFRRKGPWRYWGHLINNCPDQSKTYIFAVDVGKGQGASNSIISVFCVDDQEKIAEFADANTPPYELARLACAALLWFGGSSKNKPLIIWEANGPGWDFGRQIVKIYQYPHYYVDRQVRTVREKRGKRYGWQSSREKKYEALGMLRRAYAYGGFINHSKEALDEALSYVHYNDGGIGPAEMIKENAEARLCHGDRVIADMLCLVAAGEVKIVKTKRPPTPQNSIGGRLRDYQLRRKRQKKTRQKRFDFRMEQYYA